GKMRQKVFRKTRNAFRVSRNRGGLTMRACRFAAFFLLMLFLVLDTLAAQNVQVNSAIPDAAAQGTINLNIAIGGNGFKRGAKSQFFISGTNDPGGIKVNSTSFVSSTQVTVNVDVADAASIANFDILVQNTDGRSGKGTGLFKVLAKGSQVCVLPSLPSNFTLVTSLNDSVPTYTGLASSVRVSHVTLGGRD